MLYSIVLKIDGPRERFACLIWIDQAFVTGQDLKHLAVTESFDQLERYSKSSIALVDFIQVMSSLQRRAQCRGLVGPSTRAFPLSSPLPGQNRFVASPLH